MDINDLVKYIRAQGCKVKVYKKKKRINGSLGEFYDEPHPHINIATKGHSKKHNVSVLLHEYGHFLQWRDGSGPLLDGICWPHNILEDWVSGYLELNQREIKMIRNTMLAIEYDADIRGYYVGIELKPDGFDPDYHLKEAHSYASAIKWAWNNRSDWNKRPKWQLWTARKLTPDKLFAPLTRKENKVLKRIKKKKTK